MRRELQATLLFMVFGCIAGPGARAQSQVGKAPGHNQSTETAIRQVLSDYQASLNHSDASASLQLYTEEAVLMAPNHQTVVGKPALRALYEGGAKAIAFKVEFAVASIVQMSPEWAYARTTSKGTTTDRHTGAVAIEANQELFILQRRQQGPWLIAAYSFSSTNPAQP